MTVLTRTLNIKTRGMSESIDLTPRLNDHLGETGLEAGILTVFAPGSTAGITTLEFEPGLQQDIPDYLEKIAPYKGRYAHHDTWHDDNGAAHIRSALVGPSLTIPFVQGRLTLGTWQQVVLIDFDTRPRQRELVLQFMGE